MPPGLDRFECYELCVQSPRHVSAFLRAVHGNHPVVLREDFCGTAALSHRWLEDAARLGERAAAIAVDLDAEAIERAFASSPSRREGAGGRAVLQHPAPTLLCADSTRPSNPDPGCDIVFVGNFSIGYLHTRRELVDYLALSRSRLGRGNAGFGGGVFVCDTYGGASAFKLGSLTRKHPSRGREIIHYHWQHEEADPLTSMVTNSISFRVEADGEIVQELPRAFVYHWRLWTIAELREAMLEAGFASTEVYADCNIAPGQTPSPVVSEELKEDWIVLVVARDI
ncbi:MAG: class I SAM-dependent methyltransferase [Phycisphaerales bacterium]|nr:class I SAM-dependent methyltransferase [Phycisphaerales bacterium]